MTLRNLSLFTGSGIGDHAAEQCGIETVAQCEIDPACMYCLERLFPHAKKFTGVHDVSRQSLRELFPIDIISGGFPCQNLSTAGRGEGIEGSRSGLWREMFRVIRQVRPTWLVIENVSAIKLRGVDRVIAPLERIGYTCWPLVVGAWAVGAPHKRDRVWIVANRSREQWEQRDERNGTGQCCELGHATGTRWNSRGTISETGERPEAQGPLSAIRREAMADAGCLGSATKRIAGNLAGPQGTTQGEAYQWERVRDAVGNGSTAVADTDEAGRSSVRAAHQRSAGSNNIIRSRWPSRPGQPQHEWEAPRLAQFGLGDATTRLAGRLRSRANKALLRMAGNGWTFPIPLLIYQWIAEQEANAEN